MKEPEPLSRDLRAFIAQDVVTVEQMEVLLLLWHGRDRWWSAGEVAERLHLSEPAVRQWLENLSGRFLDVRLGESLCYRFAPGNGEREKRVEELALACEEHRTEVMSLLLSSRAARAFAEAFRLKKRSGP
jgi:hypothetical protein